MKFLIWPSAIFRDFCDFIQNWPYGAFLCYTVIKDVFIKKTGFKFVHAALSVLFLVFLAFQPLTASASRNVGEESRACDSFVLQSHGHAAWMGAQRDIEFSEEILLKPDSVLQYSCFVGKNSQPILTAGLPKYIGDNFGKAYARGSLCVDMAKIWHSLKCRDFNRKHFMTYEALTTIDPRVSYIQCDTPVRSGPSGRQSALPIEGPHRWAGAIAPIRTLQKGQGSIIPVSMAMPSLEKSVTPPKNLGVLVQDRARQPRRWGREITHAYPPPGTPPINGAADAVVTYNKKMYAHAGRCSDAKPVSTGIKMTTQNRNFDDAVCSIPGCVFNGTACVPQ
jgi:hypothetical protein